MKTQVKTESEIAAMRTGGQILAAVLKLLTERLEPGITTRELAQVAAKELNKLGGQPAFLGYQGFPDVICISVNHEIVHGVPGSYKLKEGDLVGLDLGVIYNGMITDGALTAGVGRISVEAQKLLEGTSQALDKGIKQARAGQRVGDISHAIERRLEASGLTVIENLSGHAVGHQVHEQPNVENFGTLGTGMRLELGLTLAIEPMASLSSNQAVLGHDQTTYVTPDGSLAAQFEHTVLITEGDPQILTIIES